MNLETVKKNITTTKKLYEKKNEYPIDCEFTLPDYCPDIERILKCNIVPRISNMAVLSDTAQVEVNAVICVLYVTKDDKLFGYEMPVSLSKSINVGSVDTETIKTYSVKTEYINCRAVNNRKIDVHGSVSVFLKLLAGEEKNYITDIADNSVVLKKMSQKLLQNTGYAVKQISVADDITITGASGSVSNIILSDAHVVVDECKTIINKAIIKLTAIFEILYLSSDYRYECIKHSIPLTQVIDIEGTDENSICKITADFCSFSLKPVTNSDGEMRTINTSAKINICAISYAISDSQIITDGYCVKYESELEKDNIPCESLVSTVNESVNVSECFEVSSQISEIIDLRCKPLHFNCKTENEHTMLCGDLAVCVSLEDENGGCKYYEKVIPYCEKISAKNCDDNCNFDLSVTPINNNYTISSSNAIDFKCELNVNGIITKPMMINAVTNMMIDEQKEKNFDDMPSLAVYYGEIGESIWDIALKYNTSSDKICETNNISSETLEEDTILLIPCM